MKRKSISARSIASGESKAARSIASGESKAARSITSGESKAARSITSGESKAAPASASKKQRNKKVSSEIHDTTNAIPIILDVQDLVQKGIFLGNYESLVIRCYSKKKLMIYEQPTPNPYGPYYLEGKNVKGWHLEAAEFAFDWYKNNCPGGSTKQWIQEKTKMSVAYTFCYVSFIVVDEDTKEETMIQAMLLAPPLDRNEWQIGMVRDATQEQVLAIIKLKQDTSEAILDKSFFNALKLIGKEVLVMT